MEVEPLVSTTWDPPAYLGAEEKTFHLLPSPQHLMLIQSAAGTPNNGTLSWALSPAPTHLSQYWVTGFSRVV